MARRSLFDEFLADLFALLRERPWWAGPLVIVVTGAVLGPGVYALLVTVFNADMAQQLRGLPYLFALSGMTLVAAVWGLALISNWRDGRCLERQKGIETIRQLSWRQFEQLLAAAYRRQGYAVDDTGRGADGGIDLILHRQGQRTIVQAKHWRSWKVGVGVVRELLGVRVSEGADDAILVTSGRATPQAERFARDNGIQLIDGTALVPLIGTVQGRRAAEAPTAGPLSSASPSATAAASVGGNREPDSAPACPNCGEPMAQRIARHGRHKGNAFWGCTRFPTCRGVQPISGPETRGARER